MKTARNLVAATAAAVCMGVIGAPMAAAEDSVVHTLGGSAELVNGNVVQAWTIKDLKPSSDVIPYSAAGKLWEATATDTAVQGSVIPIVSNLNARARSGQTYRVLFGVATPQGVNPSTLSQGQQVTGKVYFDVTGDAPDSVVYSAGGPDLAVWVQPPPAPPRASSVGSGSSYSAPSAAGGAEVAPAEDAPASTVPGAAPAAVEGEGVAVVPGSAGTPVVPGSEGAAPSVSAGTPVEPSAAVAPSVSAGTPVPPAGVEATAPGGGLAPAAVQHAPAAASSGTPVTPGPAEVSPPAVVAPSASVLPPA
ncbi:DUF1942 domain-containing protein [Mycobacterium sp. MS1601]|uniref:MPT63 family protein n=1 Tax=Mycobacterium sp. MS1601 TaxID=1936029 RepID=UPI0026BD3A10